MPDTLSDFAHDRDGMTTGVLLTKAEDTNVPPTIIAINGRFSALRAAKPANASITPLRTNAPDRAYRANGQRRAGLEKTASILSLLSQTVASINCHDGRYRFRTALITNAANKAINILKPGIGFCDINRQLRSKLKVAC
jgi:hypothetical protein